MFYFTATEQQAISISTCDNYKLKYAIGHAFCVCNFESTSSSGLGTAIIYSHVYLQKETYTATDCFVQWFQHKADTFKWIWGRTVIPVFSVHCTIIDMLLLFASWNYIWQKNSGSCLILKKSKNYWGRMEQNSTDRFAHDRHTCVRMHIKSQWNNVYISATNSVSL